MKVCLELFLTFLKVSLFTLGGGLAMLPLIQREVVDRRKWIGKEEFLDMISISNSLPGAIVVNVATPVGYKLKGARGAMSAVLGAVLPPFIVIVLVASAFLGIKDSPVVQAMFKGIRPCVVGLIAIPVLGLSKAAGINRKTVMIPVVVVLAVVLLRIHPVYIVLLAIVVDVAWVLCSKRARRK